MVRQRWQDLCELLCLALDNLPPAEFDREFWHARRGPLTGCEILLVVARHAAEHLGQAELTRDLLNAARGWADRLNRPSHCSRPASAWLASPGNPLYRMIGHPGDVSS